MVILLGTGFFFTVYLGLPQVRYGKRSLRLMLGLDKSSEKSGDTSPFQALATSLASSIGAGSIVGVSVAIHIGGPSSMFWMWITAFMGMATRMAETTASHHYREKSAGGTMVGGPMYYMRNKLKLRWLGGIFAVGTITTSFLAGNMAQINGMSNSLYFSLTHVFHLDWDFHTSKMLIGIFLSVLTGAVVLGGIKRIAQVTEWLVPIMTMIYLLLVFFVVTYNYAEILPAFHSMWKNAFHITSASGGFLGAGVMKMVQFGTSYGFFTNDAGTGSAGIAHAATEETSSGKVGIMSMLEPCISTWLLCTLTALAILTSGSWKEKVFQTFEPVDIEVVRGSYDDGAPALHAHATGKQKLSSYTGKLHVNEGKVVNGGVTLFVLQSVAEEVVVQQSNKPFTGELTVKDGYLIALDRGIVIKGKSLLSATELAIQTFRSNPLGDLCLLLMILCLLLFAFSTVISYSYFGDRALIYLGGEKYVGVYRFIYVMVVFLGAVTPATLVWKAAVISCAMMAFPNLLGLLLMRKDIKEQIGKAVNRMR